MAGAKSIAQKLGEIAEPTSISYITVAYTGKHFLLYISLHGQS